MVGPEVSTIWDLSDAILWQTSSEDPQLNDLIRTDIYWKNSSKLAHGGAAGIYGHLRKFNFRDGNGGAKASPFNGSRILRVFDFTNNDTETSKNVDVVNSFYNGAGKATKNWSAVNALVCGTGEFVCENISAVLLTRRVNNCDARVQLSFNRVKT